MLLLPRLPARSFTTLLILILFPGFLNTLWNDTLLVSWLYPDYKRFVRNGHSALHAITREVPVLELKPGEWFFSKVFKKMRTPLRFLRDAVIDSASISIVRGNYMAVFEICRVTSGSRLPAPVGRTGFFNQSGRLSAWHLRLAFI